MAIEIERKFLVTGDSWREHVVRQENMRPGYLNRVSADGSKASVRIRITGDEAFLNIKEAKTGSSRMEYDYGVPLPDASEMLDALCQQPLIEKTRYIVEYAGFTWEIDVFHGHNAGLVVAEIELPSEDTVFEKPGWLGREVTAERRYYNAALSENPYSDWTADERQASESNS
ncbi:MAG: CYTH domain-containing protein [Gammaproteobacteria bacterium]|nr:CYTH domain-containing protein [Gammaproteobacteria bacterium]